MILKYGDCAKLCYNDTDSFIYQIKTKDFYSNISGDVKERFDMSGYMEDRPLPRGLNKKVIGLMKDELGGKIMTEFVALRPKSYAYRKPDNKQHKKCKGIKKCIVKNTISLVITRIAYSIQRVKVSTGCNLMFRNNKHEIHTVEIDKVALNRDDDKQIVKKDGISTLVCGHCSLCWNSYLGLYRQARVL